MGLPRHLEADVRDIGQIDAVPSILNLVCELTGMGFAAVARVTEDRWVACGVLDKIGFGLQPGGELVVQTTICDEIRDSGKLVTIDHVSEDPAFCAHHTPAMYGFQSYISVPLRLPAGEFFGTLCAIDPHPHKVSTPEVIKSFELWAELIAFHLEGVRKLATSEANLQDEREKSQLREQFIAVLGHDLRSPLAAISAGTAILDDEVRSGEGRHMLQLVHQSAQRGMGIVDNVLDFARGRLGGGIPCLYSDEFALQAALQQVVAEFRVAHPARQIVEAISALPPLRVDISRLGQLLSNLLANALSHGDEAGPVRVVGRLHEGEFELAVSNLGAPIPEDKRQQLFKPFFRGDARARGEGLGLGLYIAAEIARAHDARLEVVSEQGATAFFFRMPVAQA